MKDDLRKYVLAENVVVKPDGAHCVSVEFDFLCPNCGRRHWARELDLKDRHRFQTVGWALRCGWVTVRMPWAKTPARDKRSVYGRKEGKD